MERKMFTRVDGDQTAHLNNILTHAGFRRSQSILYRPACEMCSACKSARIPVSEFKPSRTQRRVQKRNADLLRLPRPAEATPEQFALLSALSQRPS
jgi:arginyl-tRNA--protein-N-Asp/Glu arginylyltransferase